MNMVRNILFRTITIGVKNVTIGERDQAQDSHYRGERSGSTLICNEDIWEFVAKEQSEGVSGWKTTKRRHQAEGHAC